ncbi:MAG TPA: nitrophenyl compound nitroreductase subunit ArsF family protein [Patescibacteria group bacterium]|nr:nitrophenyl compound nitroreductase subunit ArsF family protein [Patescibacteria group bacterium]
MKKTKILIIFLILISFILTGCSKKSENTVYYFKEDGTKTTVNPDKSEEAPADKLEIYYFHGNTRCAACNTAGEYVSNTISQYFSEEVENGVIDFREINVDLAENKEVARKFKATGSSLYINKIVDDQDNIEQESRIWRLLNNEAQFEDYLKDKLNSYLGK